MTISVGIDFGTSTCCISYVDGDGSVKIIPNNVNCSFTIPSLVAIREGCFIAGSEALGYENDVVANFKRLIGHRADEPDLYRFFRFPLCQKDAQLCVVKDGQEYLLEDIIVAMLKKLSFMVDDYFSHQDWQCVITVPAYFNEEQRKILWTAIRICGIRCIKLLNEPSSACLAYLKDKSFDNLKVLVFDFGAGTLDLSVIDVEKSGEEVLCEVCGVHGDNNLGGIDVTRVIGEHFGITYEHAEEAKKQEGIRFNDVLEEHFGGRIRECIDKVLDVAKTGVDEVVLIGGSSKLPWIRQLIRHHINIEPVMSVNNFEEKAVSLGAALHCDHVTNHRSIVLVDRMPLSLGVDAMGLMSVIIPRNSVIPTSRTKMFTTEEEQQEVVTIDVYQGESKFLENNVLIGSFKLEGIPPMSKGEPVIYVTIKVDVNGIVEVNAREKRGNLVQQLKIRRHNIDEEMIKEMHQRVDREHEMLFHKLHTVTYKLYTLVEKVNYQVFDNCVLDLDDTIRERVFRELIQPVIETVSLLRPYEQKYKLNLGKWNAILELDDDVETVDIRVVIDQMEKWIRVIERDYTIYLITDTTLEGYVKEDTGCDHND